MNLLLYVKNSTFIFEHECFTGHNNYIYKDFLYTQIFQQAMYMNCSSGKILTCQTRICNSSKLFTMLKQIVIKLRVVVHSTVVNTSRYNQKVLLNKMKIALFLENGRKILLSIFRTHACFHDVQHVVNIFFKCFFLSNIGIGLSFEKL